MYYCDVLRAHCPRWIVFQRGRPTEAGQQRVLSHNRDFLRQGLASNTQAPEVHAAG